MAVTTTHAFKLYNGNGVTTVFPVDFQFFASTDLIVTLISALGVETVKVISTHYTVSGGTDANGLPATGTLTMLVAPATGEKLRIDRNTPLTQSTVHSNNDAFPAKTVEAAYDRAVLIEQENRLLALRAAKLSIRNYVAGIDPTLPDPLANAFLVWNEDADGLESVGAGDASLVVVDTDETLAADSDARVPSQAAIKAYVDQIVSFQDAMVFKGIIDCSANPNYPAADRGWIYRVSVAGKIGGASGPNVEVGDTLICSTDATPAGDHATVGAQWTITQANIDGAVTGPSSATDSHFAQFDGTTGKLLKGLVALDTDGTLAANSDARLATQKAIKTYADLRIVGPASVTDENPTVFDGTTGKLAKQLTYAQFLAKLAAFAGDSGSGGVKGLVPAPAAGDAAATKFLNAAGVWAVPTSAAGISLLNSGTVSAAATLDIVLTAYTAYRGLKLIFYNFVPATDDVAMWLRFSTDGGSSYDAGASNYNWSSSRIVPASGIAAGAADTEIQLTQTEAGTNNISNVTAEGGISGWIEIMGQTETGIRTSCLWECQYWNAGATAAFWVAGAGRRATAQDTDALRLLFSSGNIASGKWALYGYA